jgi:hypothetical protein
MFEIGWKTQERRGRGSGLTSWEEQERYNWLLWESGEIDGEDLKKKRDHT